MTILPRGVPVQWDHAAGNSTPNARGYWMIAQCLCIAHEFVSRCASCKSMEIQSGITFHAQQLAERARFEPTAILKVIVGFELCRSFPAKRKSSMFMAHHLARPMISWTDETMCLTDTRLCCDAASIQSRFYGGEIQPHQTTLLLSFHNPPSYCMMHAWSSTSSVLCCSSRISRAR